MKRKQRVLYKFLIVGVIVLFIGIGVQPAFAVTYNENNSPPEPPIIDGPDVDTYDVEIEFSFKSIDPENDDIAKYIIDWGDGIQENLTGPFGSGVKVVAIHVWYNVGKYIIKAKAVDIHGAESNWSVTDIDIPITNDNDDCNLCAKKVSKPYLSLIIGLFNILDKYEYQISELFKYHPELEGKYQELSENISELRILDKETPFCTLIMILSIITQIIMEILFLLPSIFLVAIFGITTEILWVIYGVFCYEP